MHPQRSLVQDFQFLAESAPWFSGNPIRYRAVRYRPGQSQLGRQKQIVSTTDKKGLS